MTTVMTLHLEAMDQARFEEMRRLYFPPERNQIPAHLTMFHSLPEALEIEEGMSRVAAEMAPFSLKVTGLRSLGKGVAYTLASPTLQRLHGSLAEMFAEHMTPQDRQPFRPHIVIQNKVTPEAARTLLEKLQPGFLPWEVAAHGLDLWRYLGGPWKHLRTFHFEDSAARQA